MSDKYCRNCEKLLQHGDIVQATVISKYVALKSKLIYSLEKPRACLHLKHWQCSNTQGEFEVGIEAEDDEIIEE